MKIIHIADIHLESKLEHYSKNKARERNLEIFTTFQSVFEFARKEKINMMLIAGDLFDQDPAPSMKKEVESLFLNYPEIKIFYLHGNHDDHIKFDLPNVYSFSSSFTSYQIDHICIGAIEDARLASTINYSKDTHNILLYHGDLPKHLNHLNLDYVALGHYHHYDWGKFDARGIYCYPGCLEARGYDEIGQKGLIVYDTDDHSITRYEVAKRDVIKAKVDLSNFHTSVEAIFKIQEVLNDIDQKNMILVELTGNLDVDHTISFQNLHSYIQQNYDFYEVRVIEDVKLKINLEKYKYDHSLKGRFIQMVLDSDEENKEEIIHYGLLALEKGDLGE